MNLRSIYCKSATKDVLSANVIVSMNNIGNKGRVAQLNENRKKDS